MIFNKVRENHKTLITLTIIAFAGIPFLWLIFPSGDEERSKEIHRKAEEIDNLRAEATYKYWMNLQTITTRSNKAFEKLLKSEEAEEAKGAITVFKKIAAKNRTDITEIKHLNTEGVDEEAVSYAADLIAISIHNGEILDQIISTGADVVEYTEYRESWTGSWDSLSQALRGDSSLMLGKKMPKLGGAFIAAMDRLHETTDEYAKKETQELKLRHRLSKRYKKPFPPLDTN